MSGYFGIRITELLALSLDLTWFLPLFAAWLTYRHGIEVLRAWWPLAVLPSLGVTLGSGVGISFGVSTATLLLALIVSAALDARLVMPPPKQWLRGNTARPVIAGFCLLVLAALDVGVWRQGPFRINLLAVVPALVLLAAIRWEALAGAVWPGRSPRVTAVLSIAAATLVLSGLVFNGALHVGPLARTAWRPLSPSSVSALSCSGMSDRAWSPACSSLSWSPIGCSCSSSASRSPRSPSLRIGASLPGMPCSGAWLPRWQATCSAHSCGMARSNGRSGGR
jgi:hypothetical protein